jgi:hypothetical protein
MNRLIPKFALLLILFISACSNPYKPEEHITKSSMKEAVTGSYATLKDSLKELRDVFFSSSE